MIRLFVTSTLVMTLLSCESKETKSTAVQHNKIELEVNTKYKGSYISENIKDSSVYFIFDVILINYAKTDIEFWTLSCTPQANVVFDSDRYNYLIPRCTGNVPIMIRLSPNQEFIVPIVLQKSYQGKDTTVFHRFGFILDRPKYKIGIKKSFDFSQDPFAELMQMRKTYENITWSKPFELYQHNEYLYQIQNIINDSSYSVSSIKRFTEK